MKKMYWPFADIRINSSDNGFNF